METRYTFYADPGHGWLKVSVKELAELGIADVISPCSYLSKGFVYLEEDCDMAIFAYAKGWAPGGNAPIDEVYQEHTPIRNYSSYYHPDYVRPNHDEMAQLMGLNDCEHHVIARSCTQCREGK